MKLTWDPVQKGAERHNSLLSPSSSARVCPKSLARAASPREYLFIRIAFALPYTIAFSICIYILPIFLPNKIRTLSPGHARQVTRSTENKALSLSTSFLLASLLLDFGDFPWSQNNYVSGSCLPVYSLHIGVEPEGKREDKKETRTDYTMTFQPPYSPSLFRKGDK